MLVCSGNFYLFFSYICSRQRFIYFTVSNKLQKENGAVVFRLCFPCHHHAFAVAISICGLWYESLNYNFLLTRMSNVNMKTKPCALIALRFPCVVCKFSILCAAVLVKEMYSSILLKNEYHLHFWRPF
jgi:hypothetical protein